MIRYLLISLLILIAGCTKKKEAAGPVDLVEAGRSRYQQNCTACHNSNPKLDGAVGPAVYGSSLELLQARVLTATYPAGYTAKRPTHLMVALPFLKDEIPALHAYLNSPGQ